MNIYKYIFLILFCFIVGLFFFAFYHELLVVRYPFGKAVSQESGMQYKKIQVDLIFWNNKKWNRETIILIWSDNKSQNIQYLINSWLTLLEDEKLIKKKVSLQAVLLSSSEKHAFLSFDQNPFSDEDTIYEKWMWIEGLLKTIRKNDILLQDIQFLIHHKEIADNHIDFSRPWPIYGFLKQ